MKAAYINPFIEAAKEVMQTLLEIDIEVGKVSLKSSPYPADNIIIMIGIVGQIKGQVGLELSFETAGQIATAMMGGVPIDSMDEIAFSAVGELGNMIMGSACTIFARNKIPLDITPPTILTGDRIRVSNKIATIVIPVTIGNYGSMSIGITAEEV